MVLLPEQKTRDSRRFGAETEMRQSCCLTPGAFESLLAYERQVFRADGATLGIDLEGNLTISLQVFL